MSHPEHRLEKRARLLAMRLREQTEAFRDELGGPHERKPFHQQMGPTAALAWWQQHRYDELGMAVLQRYSVTDIAALDRALAEQQEAQQMGLSQGGY